MERNVYRITPEQMAAAVDTVVTIVPAPGAGKVVVPSRIVPTPDGGYAIETETWPVDEGRPVEATYVTQYAIEDVEPPSTP